MNKRGPISVTDIILVKRFLILPLVLSAFERDKGHIEHSGYFKTPALYTDLINRAMDEATKEIASVRKAFRDRGIKVYEEQRTGKGVEAKYMCRGYHSEISLLWSYITSEATVLMRLFLGQDVSRYVNPSIPDNMQQETTLFSQNDETK